MTQTIFNFSQLKKMEKIILTLAIVFSKLWKCIFLEAGWRSCCLYLLPIMGEFE